MGYVDKLGKKLATFTDKQEGKARFRTSLQDYPPMGLDASITIECLNSKTGCLKEQ